MESKIDKTKYVGEVYESKYGEYEIIEYVGCINRKPSVKVKFKLTGSEVICRYDTAYKGFAKDPEYYMFITKDKIYETCCGPVEVVGYLGFINHHHIVMIRFLLTNTIKDEKFDNILNGYSYDSKYFMYTVKDKIFHSNSYGDYKIIAGLFRNSYSQKMVRIKFLATGYEYDVTYAAALEGKVKDPEYFMYTVKDKVFRSNNYGEFKVLEKIDLNDKNHSTDLRIKFIATNAETIVSYSDFLSGEIKDPSFKNISHARSVLGPMQMQNINYILSKNWGAMMNRCYNESSSGYPRYGLRGVTVDPEWHCKENFIRDAMNLPGWNDKFMDPANFNLDKDLFQCNIPRDQRVYSKKTCIWLYKGLNSKMANNNCSNVIIHYNCIYQIENIYYIKTPMDNCPNYGPFTDLNAAVNMLNYCYQMYGLYNMIIPLNNIPYITQQQIFKDYTTDSKIIARVVK